MRRIAALASAVAVLALGAVGAAPAMATSTVLGAGGSLNDTACVWTIDYDDVSETIGLTATSIPVQIFTITLTMTASGQTYSLNAIPYANQGRVVLAGPGSVLGFTNPVVPGSFPLPPYPKGTVPPYTLSDSCTL